MLGSMQQMADDLPSPHQSRSQIGRGLVHSAVGRQLQGSFFEASWLAGAPSEGLALSRGQTRVMLNTVAKCAVENPCPQARLPNL